MLNRTPPDPQQHTDQQHADSIMPPTLLGRYRLAKCLVFEGNRQVWQAFDVLERRAVALKGMLQTSDCPNASSLVLDEWTRLHHFQHPRLVRAFDPHVSERGPSGEDGPFFFFVQEWLDGPSLQTLAGELSVQEVEQCAIDTLELVAFFHHQRLTRLDLKSAHFLKTSTGWTLIDLDQAAPERPLASPELHGTIAYAAPEILEGLEGGPRADLYSLGAVLFEALCGSPPPVVGKTMEAIRAWKKRTLPPALPPELVAESSPIAHLITALLQPNPLHRPASAEEALTSLGQTSNDWRVRAPLPQAVLQCSELLEHVHEAWNRATDGRLRIVGPSGSGKHTLLLALQRSLCERQVGVIHIGPDPSGDAPMARLVSWLEGLAFQAGAARTAPPPVGTPPDSRELWHRWATALRALFELRCTQRQPPFLVLLERIDQWDAQSLLALCRGLPYWPEAAIRVVMTHDDAWDPPAPLACLPSLAMPTLLAADVRSIADSLLGPGAVSSMSEVQRLLVACAGRPGLLRVLLEPRWRALEQAGEHAGELASGTASTSPPDVGNLKTIAEPPLDESLQIGKRLLEQRSLKQANGHVGKLLSRLRQLPLIEQHLLPQVLLLSGDIQLQQGAPRAALPLLQEALEGFQGLEESLHDVIRARVLLTYAQLELQSWHDVSAGLLALQTLLRDHTPSSKDGQDLSTVLTQARLDLLHLEASLQLRTGQVLPGLYAELEAGVGKARALGATRALHRLLNCQTQVAVHLGQEEGREEQVRALLTLLADSSYTHFDAGAEMIARHRLGEWYARHGQLEPALEAHERAGRLASRQGHRLQALRSWLEGAKLLLDARSLERANEMLERCRSELAVETPLPPSVSVVYQLYHLRHRRLSGEGTVVLPELERLEQTCRAEGAVQRLGATAKLVWLESRLERATLCLEAGRDTEALGLVNDALASGTRDPSPEEKRSIQSLHSLAMEAHRRLAGAVGPLAGNEEPAGGVLSRGEGPSTEKESTVGTRATSSDPIAFLDESWLSDLEEILRVTDEPELLAQACAKVLGERLQGRGLIVVWESRGQMHSGSFRIEPAHVGELSSSVVETVRRTRQPVAVADLLVEAHWRTQQSLRAARVRSLLCLPLLVEQECVGVLYLDHPVPERLTHPALQSALERMAQGLAPLLRRRAPSLLSTPDGTSFGLLGTSPAIQTLRARLQRLADAASEDMVVMFLGESGTGKSYLARRLHLEGLRREHPFIAVNASALPPSLFESQLFGHVKGAFTGAYQAQSGFLERAETGTLFLDEIGDLPLELQPRLLTVLSGTHEFQRLGDTKSKVFRAQLFCATTHDLDALAKQGLFRSELLRRLSVHRCVIPSLRERGAEDIRLLTETMIHTWMLKGSLVTSSQSKVTLEDYFSRDAVALLLSYHWPWNVGQLENVLRHEDIRASLRTLGQERIGRHLLEDVLTQTGERPRTREVAGGFGQGRESNSFQNKENPSKLEHLLSENALWPQPPSDLTYKGLGEWIEQQKKVYLTRRLEAVNGNVTELSRDLECVRDVIYKYVPRGDASRGR